jgi:hypothetical protein
MGTTTVDTGHEKFLSERTIRLGTSTFWQAERVFLASGASIVNPAVGVLQFDTHANLEFGGGAPSNLVNEGTMRFSGAAKRVVLPNFVNTGTVVQRLGGLSPGIDFDQVVVSGGVTLGGTLDVQTIGGFVPAIGNSFDLLTYGSRSGEFGTIQGNGEIYTATYGSSALTLTRP